MASQGPQARGSSSTNPFFILLGLVGTARLWGAFMADGTMNNLFKALAQGGDFLLPGTSVPIKKNYTGIWPLDFMCSFFILFFWEAVDGSHPASSATGIYFLGQIFPLLACVYMDSLRQGQGFQLLKTSAWVFLYQLTGIGCTGSMWALLYTASSVTASLSAPKEVVQRASLVSPQMVAFIVPAITLGFALPGALMGISAPEFASYDFQQWMVVMWNIFPVNMFVLLHAFAAVGPLLTGRPNYKPAASTREHLTVVRWVSVISMAVGFAWHVAVATISLTSFFFPVLFKSRFLPHFDPVYLATPPPFLEGGETVGDGVRSFMIWDMVFGFAFVMAVMLVQLRTAARFSNFDFGWVQSGIVCTLLSFVVGPGTVMMGVSWLRDEVLFEKTETRSPKKRNGY